MDYRRKIIDSKEFNDYINSLNNKILVLTNDIEILEDTIKKYAEESSEYGNAIINYRKIKQALYSSLNKRMLKTQKIKDISFVTGLSIAGVVAINFLPGTDQTVTNLIHYIGSSAFIITAAVYDISILREKSIGIITDSTFNSAYSKKKNEDLIKDIEENEKCINNTWKKADDVSNKIVNIRYEIHDKEVELRKITEERDCALDIATGYDSINDFDRYVMNNRAFTTKKNSNKVLIKRNTHNYNYGNFIK